MWLDGDKWKDDLRFDAWVSRSLCIPSIVGRMRRRWKKLKEEKNRIVEKVVEGVSTIRSGKQRKVSSKGKRKKKGSNFREHQLFSSAFDSSNINLTFVYCFVSKNYCIVFNLLMFCEFILLWKLTFYDEYAFKGLYMYGVKCGTFSLLLCIFLFKFFLHCMNMFWRSCKFFSCVYCEDWFFSNLYFQLLYVCMLCNNVWTI